jgi:hypothetical protein
MYKKKSIKKELKKKGLIILNVIDNIKWKLGVLQFHSAYTRAPLAPSAVDSSVSLFISFQADSCLSAFHNWLLTIVCPQTTVSSPLASTDSLQSGNI